MAATVHHGKSLDWLISLLSPMSVQKCDLVLVSGHRKLHLPMVLAAAASPRLAHLLKGHQDYEQVCVIIPKFCHHTLAALSDLVTTGGTHGLNRKHREELLEMCSLLGFGRVRRHRTGKAERSEDAVVTSQQVLNVQAKKISQIIVNKFSTQFKNLVPPHPPVRACTDFKEQDEPEVISPEEMLVQSPMFATSDKLPGYPEQIKNQSNLPFLSALLLSQNFSISSRQQDTSVSMEDRGGQEVCTEVVGQFADPGTKTNDNEHTTDRGEVLADISAHPFEEPIVITKRRGAMLAKSVTKDKQEDQDVKPRIREAAAAANKQIERTFSIDRQKRRDSVRCAEFQSDMAMEKPCYPGNTKHKAWKGKRSEEWQLNPALKVVKPGQGAKFLGETLVIQSNQANPPVNLLTAQQPSMLPKSTSGVVTSSIKTYLIHMNPNVPNTAIQSKLGNVGGIKQVLVNAPDQSAAPPDPPKELTPLLPPPKELTPPAPPREPTPPQPRITISAQLVQTPKGPRIILQGLQGQLQQQQLVSIQQQVKKMLLKQQALARNQGKVPPTKVTMQLPSDFAQREVEQQPSEAVSSKTYLEAATASPVARNTEVSSVEHESPYKLNVFNSPIKKQPSPHHKRPTSIGPTDNHLSDEVQQTVHDRDDSRLLEEDDANQKTEDDQVEVDLSKFATAEALTNDTIEEQESTNEYIDRKRKRSNETQTPNPKKTKLSLASDYNANLTPTDLRLTLKPSPSQVVCGVCDQLFKNRVKFKSHLFEHYKSGLEAEYFGVIQCQFCPFWSTRKLAWHIGMTHDLVFKYYNEGNYKHLEQQISEVKSSRVAAIKQEPDDAGENISIVETGQSEDNIPIITLE